MQLRKFSLIIPVGPTHDDTRRFCEIALPSFVKFLRVEHVCTVHVVTPRGNVNTLEARVQSVLKTHGLAEAVVVWADDDIIGEALDGSVVGWFRQQLIKLRIALRIKTPYYIPLDADHFLVSSFEPAAFIAADGNRILYTPEPWQTVNGLCYSVNSQWWQQSCDLLQQPLTIVENCTELMGVTPQILHTRVVCDMLDHLAVLYGARYISIMVERKFTEFTLYWAFLRMQRLDTVLYVNEPTSPVLWKHDLLRNVLHHQLYTEYIHAHLELAFREPSMCFCVVQSYLNIPVDVVRHVTDKYF